MFWWMGSTQRDRARRGPWSLAAAWCVRYLREQRDFCLTATHMPSSRGSLNAHMVGPLDGWQIVEGTCIHPHLWRLLLIVCQQSGHLCPRAHLGSCHRWLLSWRTQGKWKSLSCVRFFATPWTMRSMEFSRPEYWSGFPSLGDILSPGIEPRSPALQADSLPTEPHREGNKIRGEQN